MRPVPRQISLPSSPRVIGCSFADITRRWLATASAPRRSCLVGWPGARSEPPCRPIGWRDRRKYRSREPVAEWERRAVESAVLCHAVIERTGVLERLTADGARRNRRAGLPFSPPVYIVSPVCAPRLNARLAKGEHIVVFIAGRSRPTDRRAAVDTRGGQLLARWQIFPTAMLRATEARITIAVLQRPMRRSRDGGHPALVGEMIWRPCLSAPSTCRLDLDLRLRRRVMS